MQKFVVVLAQSPWSRCFQISIDNIWDSLQDFGTFCISEQRSLASLRRLARFPCSHTQSMCVDVGSDRNLDLQLRFIRGIYTYIPKSNVLARTFLSKVVLLCPYQGQWSMPTQFNSNLFANHITFGNEYMKCAHKRQRKTEICDKLRKSTTIKFSFRSHRPLVTPVLTAGIVTESAEGRPPPAFTPGHKNLIYFTGIHLTLRLLRKKCN